MKYREPFSHPPFPQINPTGLFSGLEKGLWAWDVAIIRLAFTDPKTD